MKRLVMYICAGVALAYFSLEGVYWTAEHGATPFSFNHPVDPDPKQTLRALRNWTAVCVGVAGVLGMMIGIQFASKK